MWKWLSFFPPRPTGLSPPLGVCKFWDSVQKFFQHRFETRPLGFRKEARKLLTEMQNDLKGPKRTASIRVHFCYKSWSETCSLHIVDVCSSIIDTNETTLTRDDMKTRTQTSGWRSIAHWKTAHDDIPEVQTFRYPIYTDFSSFSKFLNCVVSWEIYRSGNRLTPNPPNTSSPKMFFYLSKWKWMRHQRSPGVFQRLRSPSQGASACRSRRRRVLDPAAHGERCF